MNVGFVGWRGMVGSVLLQRMAEEGDFVGLVPQFFSTSNVGGSAPSFGPVPSPPLGDAYDLSALSKLDVIVTCQGGDYTTKIYQPLRARGWSGYWIDAASSLRMENDAIIILDPVNGDAIRRGIAGGVKTFVGGNCTVSLMIMALAGLFKEGLVEWVSSMTYQSASGAGAAQMKELIGQHAFIERGLGGAESASADALSQERLVRQLVQDPSFPIEGLGYPLAFNVLPFIDRQVEEGQSREEWKGGVETNKILNPELPIIVDGICVRVGSLRCHSQALTIKLRRDLPMQEIEERIRTAHEWVSLVPNVRELTLSRLSPAAVSGSLTIAIGRLRKLRMGGEYLSAFTVGDQLLWGAAEPLRRMLRILRTGG